MGPLFHMVLARATLLKVDDGLCHFSRTLSQVVSSEMAEAFSSSWTLQTQLHAQAY